MDDYPVRLQRQREVPERGSRLRPIVWSAQIVNWWQIAGHGETAAEALADLQTRFSTYRQSHDSLPRPGTGRPPEFASSAVVEYYDQIARDFLARILDLNYDECFISDESSLWDFHGEHDNDEYFRKVLVIYGVDVADVPGANLAGIFERIAHHRSTG